MSQFSFPILNTAEILDCLAEIDLSISEAQLTKPTYEVVRPVYEHLVTTLLGVTREELQQPVFMAIDALEFPELHDESIPAMAFVKALSRLMLAAGVKDFSLKDLYKPDAQRLRRNLSAIINFTKFREDKLIPYAGMQEQLEALVQERLGLEQITQQLTSEIDRIRLAREAQQTEVARLDAEIQELYVQNQQLNKQQSGLNSEVRGLKQKNNQTADECSNEKFKLMNIQQECEKIRGQIVQSPEKLQSSLSQIAHEVDRERALLAEADKKSRELQSRLEAIGKLERDIHKTIKALEEVDSEVSRKKETSQKVKAIKEEIAAHEADVQQLQATQQHLRRQHSSLEERIHRLEHQANLRKEAAASRVDEQLKDKEAIEAENAAAVAKLKENDALMRSLKDKMTDLQTKHNSQINVVLEQFNWLKKQVSQYHVELETAMAPSPNAAALNALQMR